MAMMSGKFSQRKIKKPRKKNKKIIKYRYKAQVIDVKYANTMPLPYPKPYHNTQSGQGKTNEMEKREVSAKAAE